MSTRTLTGERTVDDRRSDQLPPLATIDRLALRLGLALILWGQQHAERDVRTGRSARVEQARRSGAADRAAGDRAATFAHRMQAGVR